VPLDTHPIHTELDIGPKTPSVAGVSRSPFRESGFCAPNQGHPVDVIRYCENDHSRKHARNLGPTPFARQRCQSDTGMTSQAGDFDHFQMQQIEKARRSLNCRF
jgi:hypothetical protein